MKHIDVGHLLVTWKAQALADAERDAIAWAKADIARAEARALRKRKLRRIEILDEFITADNPYHLPDLLEEKAQLLQELEKMRPAPKPAPIQKEPAEVSAIQRQLNDLFLASRLARRRDQLEKLRARIAAIDALIPRDIPDKERLGLLRQLKEALSATPDDQC